MYLSSIWQTKKRGEEQLYITIYNMSHTTTCVCLARKNLFPIHTLQKITAISKPKPLSDHRHKMRIHRTQAIVGSQWKINGKYVMSNTKYITNNINT